MSMNYSLNYEVNTESQDGKLTKQNNQFLSVVDLYSLDPTNLKVIMSSANFGEGNYPDLAKHRWIVRTQDGFFLRLNFETIEIEDDIDTVDVYKLHDNAEKELVDRVNVAKQFLVKCNQAEIVFRSDCTVNRIGFKVTIQSFKRIDQKEITTTKALSSAIQNTKTITPSEITNIQNTTPKFVKTERISREIPTTQQTTTEISTTHNIIPKIIATQNTTTPQTVQDGYLILLYKL